MGALRSALVVFLLVVLGSLASPAVDSAHCVNYGDFIHWMDSIDTSGAARDIAVSGSLAHIVTTPGNLPGVGLDVVGIDMSGMHPPEILGSVDLGGAYVAEARVTASGAYAYVTTFQPCQGGAFRAVDASDPAHPELVGELAILGDIYAVAVSGTVAYLAEGCLFEGIEVIDVSDPWRPRKVGGLTTAGYAYGLAVSGTRAYVSVLDWDYPYTGRLQVIDISDPERPSILGSVVMPQVPPDYEYSVGPVAVSGKRAYVAAGDSWVYVVDISDPSNPRLVGRAYGGAHTTASRLVVSGGYLYVSGSPCQVFDLSNPAYPELVGSVDLGFAGGALAIAGPAAYTTHGGRLHRIAITNPESPPVLGRVDTPGQARDVAVEGNHVHVADWPEELRVIDTADPMVPKTVGHLAIAGGVERVAARGPLVYVAQGSGSSGGLAVIDVSRPSSPHQLGSVAFQHSSRGLAVAGHHAYVSGNADAGRLSVIDITDPHHPSVESTVSTSGVAYGLAVSQTRAFVAVRSDYPYVHSLRVIDVSTPASPLLVGSVDLPLGADSVALSGDYAFVLGFDLQVVDVSDPFNPRLVGIAYSPGWTGNFGGVAIRGDVAYAAKERSVEVFDVSDPAHPRFVGSAPSGGGTVAVSNEVLCAGAGLRGVLVLPSQCQP